MSAPVRRLVVGLAAAVALFGAGPVTEVGGHDEGVGTAAAATARTGGIPGPDGVDPQHNETMLRDLA